MATPRLSATLGERLPRRLSDSQRLPATPRLSATLRLSATFDFRPAGDRQPPTTRRDPARHAGTPRGRRDRPRLVSHDRPRCGGSPAPPGAAKARPNAAPYIGAIYKRKSLEKLLTHKQKHLLYEYKQKRLCRRRRKRPRSPEEGTT